MYSVEFAGAPGVGKSTVYRSLVKRLQLADKDSYLTLNEAFMLASRSNIDRIYRYVMRMLPYDMAVSFSNMLLYRSVMQFEAQNRFLAQWGGAFNSFLRSAEFSDMSIDERTVVISAFIHVGSVFECIRGDLPEKMAVFFDEGFVQKSLMFISPVSVRPPDRSCLTDYLERIPVPDIIIYINADIELCYERMISRPGGFTRRLSDISKKRALDFLKASDDHVRDAVSWMQTNKGVDLIEIMNEGELDKVVLETEKKFRGII